MNQLIIRIMNHKKNKFKQNSKFLKTESNSDSKSDTKNNSNLNSNSNFNFKKLKYDKKKKNKIKKNNKTIIYFNNINKDLNTKILNISSKISNTQTVQAVDSD